jgi:hypothetical protein
MERDLILPKSKVILNESHYVTSGSDRSVFFHPNYPDILFKTLLEIDKNSIKGFRGFSLRMLPSTRARMFLKEYECHTFINYTNNEKTGDMPITSLYGFIQTNFGIASLVERIRLNNDEIIGPTLYDLHKQDNINEEVIIMLNDFAKNLKSWEVRTTDITLKNVVLGVRNGRKKFILVDGIGDKFAIPLRTWFKTAMIEGHHESFRKIARRIDLKWSRKSFRFEVLH